VPEDSAREFLTVADVVALKSVSAAAVYQAIREERLAAERVLNRWAIRPEAAEAWKPHGYKDRPGPKRRGRKKGTKLDDETRQLMSESAKKGWRRRKGETE
jgi:hypothetical protein